MNYRELLAYLDENWHKTALGQTVRYYPFDSLRRLLAEFGNPQLTVGSAGVTGSKGKGSIARMLATVLQAHGLRTGLFTSPHLVAVEERIVLDGRPIDPNVLAARFGDVLAAREAAGLIELGISTLLLVVALAYFREAGADAIVLEVRAGGRYDPTAVAPARAVCIGPIGLEHVPGLGRTVAEIAWQKVGLVKPGAVCLSSQQEAEAERVIERECATLGAPLLRLGRELRYRVRSRDAAGQTIDLATPTARFAELRLAMLGEHQAANAALAVGAAAVVLGGRQRELEHGALAAALAGVRWPGRLERLSERPLVLYDGAHTPESTRVLARALADHFPDRRWSFLVGVLRGKRTEALLAELRPVAARVVAVPVPGFSFEDPAAVAQSASQLGIETVACDDLAAALGKLSDLGDPICVTGTLYLYAATRSALGISGPAL